MWHRRRTLGCMRWVHAIALIVAGLVLAGLGGAHAMRPTSSGPARPQPYRTADHLDSQFAEMHQNLQLHRACTEAGWPDEWPCAKFSPAER